MTSFLDTLVSKMRATNDTAIEAMADGGSTTIRGTGDADLLQLRETSGHVTVKARGGKDQVELYGLADYRAKLGNGDDTLLIDTVGRVTAEGGTGDDLIEIDEMNAHHVDGADGRDWLSFEGLGARIIADLTEGTARSVGQAMTMESIEHLSGSDFDDVVRGSGEANRIEGLGGDDQIFGEDGKDKLFGGDGDDVIDGGASHDDIDGGEGHDLIFGGEGADEIFGEGGNDRIDGGDGADYVAAGAGNDHVLGGDAADANDDTFHGGNGSDTLDYHFAAGGVVIDADAGTVTGAGAGLKASGNTDSFTGFEEFHGTAHDDVILTSADREIDEVLLGGEGDDLFMANAGQEVFSGAWDKRLHEGDEARIGFDVVDYSGFDGRVTADLSSGDGTIFYELTGGGANDFHIYVEIDGITGTVNADSIRGDAGDNRIDGHHGSDELAGGDGADTFAFREGAGSVIDVIEDFESGVDLIELTGMEIGGGARAEDFGDLDTNGDGVLNEFDLHFTKDFDSGDGILTLGDQTIKLTGVTELTPEDFAFV